MIAAWQLREIPALAQRLGARLTGSSWLTGLLGLPESYDLRFVSKHGLRVTLGLESRKIRRVSSNRVRTLYTGDITWRIKPPLEMQIILRKPRDGQSPFVDARRAPDLPRAKALLAKHPKLVQAVEPLLRGGESAVVFESDRVVVTNLGLFKINPELQRTVLEPALESLADLAAVFEDLERAPEDEPPTPVRISLRPPSQ